MKWLGALMIIVSTTMIGFMLAKRVSERPRQLRMLKVALQAMEAEITYGLTPILTVAENLIKQLPRPISTFFEVFVETLENKAIPLHEAWERSLKEVWPKTALKKGELEVMQQFGTTLGRHDRENQQKQIHLALSHLEREEAEAKDMQIKYESMFKSLGFLTGLLIVLVLI